MEDLTPWLEQIDAEQARVRKATGVANIAMYDMAAQLLSAPRRIGAALRGAPAHDRSPLQKPWFPLWPGLAGKPVYESADFAWVAGLRQALPDIRKEMEAVTGGFERGAYESGVKDKPWNTYCFYLQHKAFAEHLRRCPRTAEALARIPTNRLHVCFSAIEPGGALRPHTGPTNASLTAHLGLANCEGAKLWVAGQSVAYRDGEVLVFDDSYVHWVEHHGSATRYTLMVTLWHPDLRAAERGYLAGVTGWARS